MARIRERKGKKGTSYQVEIRLRGHTETQTFSRKTDAKDWAKDIETQIKRGEYFSVQEARKRSVAELIKEYKANILPTRGKDKVTVKGHLDWWIKEIGHYRLSEIKPSVLAERREKLLEQGKANNTVIRYFASLSVCYTYSINELEWINENPCMKVRKPPEGKGRVRFLDIDEQQRLLTACLNSKEKYLYPVVFTALWTGGRMGEILGLRWEDIDFENKNIRFLDTKNGESRAVPLHDEVMSVLLDLKDSSIPRIDTKLIFARSDGKAPKEIKKPFRKAVDKAKLTDFRFHDLRHTTASYLVMSGSSLIEVATILGHKNLKMVQKYAHLAPDHNAKVINRFGDYLLKKSM